MPDSQPNENDYSELNDILEKMGINPVNAGTAGGFTTPENSDIAYFVDLELSSLLREPTNSIFTDYMIENGIDEIFMGYLDEDIASHSDVFINKYGELEAQSPFFNNGENRISLTQICQDNPDFNFVIVPSVQKFIKQHPKLFADAFNGRDGLPGIVLRTDDKGYYYRGENGDIINEMDYSGYSYDDWLADVEGGWTRDSVRYSTGLLGDMDKVESYSYRITHKINRESTPDGEGVYNWVSHKTLVQVDMDGDRFPEIIITDQFHYDNPKPLLNYKTIDEGETVFFVEESEPAVQAVLSNVLDKQGWTRGE